MSGRVFLFTGAGNNFVVLDGRQGGMDAFRQVARISELCRQFATDGLMILGLDSEVDFSMEFYNPDGSGGMMCGNGGRCIVAFADYLGLQPAAPDGTWLFRAPDGLHTATILERGDLPESPLRGPSHLSRCAHQWAPPSYRAEGGQRFWEVSPLQRWTVKLKMIDVQGIEAIKDGYFLNTGTRHYVQFVPDVDAMDMEREAKPLRWDPAFQPEGTNVNFVQVAADGLHVRTFEKGVEGETLACGTGITASAIAAYVMDGADRPAACYRLQCRRGDWLQVDFHPGPDNSFTEVYLTGPAELVKICE